jgi:hypothetical protein
MVSCFSGSRDELAIKAAETSKTGVVGMSHHHVVENFEFQKLTCWDEIAGDFDVRLGPSRISTRTIVSDDDCRCAPCDDKGSYPSSQWTPDNAL